MIAGVCALLRERQCTRSGRSAEVGEPELARMHKYARCRARIDRLLVVVPAVEVLLHTVR